MDAEGVEGLFSVVALPGMAVSGKVASEDNTGELTEPRATWIEIDPRASEWLHKRRNPQPEDDPGAVRKKVRWCHRVRSACVACHERKQRCIALKKGSCKNCFDNKRECIPRVQKRRGRPKNEARTQESFIPLLNSMLGSGDGLHDWQQGFDNVSLDQSRSPEALSSGGGSRAKIAPPYRMEKLQVDARTCMARQHGSPGVSPNGSSVLQKVLPNGQVLLHVRA